MLPLLMAILAAADSDLLLRLQKRDPQALADLYDRYGKLVYGLILRVVRDSATAEDLVQETFLRVWNRAGTLDAERGAAGPWLLAIARNRAIDYLRSHGRRLQNTVDLSETEHATLFANLPKEAAQLDIAQHVKRALGRLNQNERETIELAYFEGMSQTEIAAHLGQPLGTVKTWMRRALQQMREQLHGGAVA